MNTRRRFNSIASLIAVFLFLLIANTMQAQNDLLNGLPENVLISFRDHCPDVSSVSWMQDQKSFVAQYEQGEKDHQLWMSAQGKILKHTVMMNEELLPTIVREHLIRVFPTGKILSVHRIEVRNKNFYQVKMKVEHEKKDYFVDEKGNEVSGT